MIFTYVIESRMKNWGNCKADADNHQWSNKNIRIKFEYWTWWYSQDPAIFSYVTIASTSIDKFIKLLAPFWVRNIHNPSFPRTFCLMIASIWRSSGKVDYNSWPISVTGSWKGSHALFALSTRMQWIHHNSSQTALSQCALFVCPQLF